MPIMTVKFIQTKPDPDDERYSRRKNDIISLSGRLKGWNGTDFGGRRPNGNVRLIVITDVPLPAITRMREHIFEDLPDEPETIRQHYGRVDLSILPAPKRAHLNNNGWVQIDFNPGLLTALIRRKKIIDIDDHTQDENEDEAVLP